MSDAFDPPVIPKADNSTGPPVPPSGLHPSTTPQIVVKPATPHVPSDTPAPNVHK
jgi:hypothetical protein